MTCERFTHCVTPLFNMIQSLPTSSYSEEIQSLQGTEPANSFARNYKSDEAFVGKFTLSYWSILLKMCGMFLLILLYVCNASTWPINVESMKEALRKITSYQLENLLIKVMLHFRLLVWLKLKRSRLGVRQLLNIKLLAKFSNCQVFFETLSSFFWWRLQILDNSLNWHLKKVP